MLDILTDKMLYFALEIETCRKGGYTYEINRNRSQSRRTWPRSHSD